MFIGCCATHGSYKSGAHDVLALIHPASVLLTGIADINEGTLLTTTAAAVSVAAQSVRQLTWRSPLAGG